MADPWAVVSTSPYSEPSEGGDPWAVKAVEPIKPRSLGERFAGNLEDAAQRNPTISALRSAFTNPRPTLPGIGARVPDVLDAMGPVGGALRAGTQIVGLASRFVEPDLAPGIARKERERREAYEAQSKADPFYTAPGGVAGKTAAGALTLGGQFAGALTDPQNFIAPGSTVAKRAAAGAALNAAGDMQSQGADVAANIQDEWQPVQTIAAGALGAGLSVTSDAAGAGARRLAEADWTPVRRMAGDAAGAIRSGVTAGVEGLAKGVSQARVAGRRAAATVDDVWSRLIRTESGGDQEAVSPKGAFGRAQLMPKTAADVAKRLGDPSLAERARTDPEANERLGRAYYQEMLDAFGGDHMLAAAAYNAGPGRVRSWLRSIGTPEIIGRQEWAARIPIEETRNYVRSVAGDYIGGGREDLDAPEPFDPAEIEFREIPDETASTRRQRSSEDNPIPTAASRDTLTPDNQALSGARDSTDEALDVLRRGGRIRDDRTSLIDWLAEQGVRDDGGELSNIGLEQWHRSRPFRRRLVREEGRSLEDAALAAQEAGYFGERFNDTRATPQDLIDAMAEELAGRPKFAGQAPELDALRQHVADLEEIMAHGGLDLNRLSNAEIKAEIRRLFSAPDNRPPTTTAEAIKAQREAANVRDPNEDPFASEFDRLSRLGAREAPQTEPVRLADGEAQQNLIPGVEPLSGSQRAISAELRRRMARRGYGELPAEGLFVRDEPRARTGDLFGDAPSGKLGAREAARDAAEAGRKVAAAVEDVKRSNPNIKLDAYVNRQGVLTVYRIVVPEAARGRGAGSETMRRLTAIADRSGLTMALSPTAHFGGSLPRLREFYRRLGFQPNTGRGRDLSISETMIRRPDDGAASERLGAVDLSAYGDQISPSRNIGGLRQAPRPGPIAKAAGSPEKATKAVASVSKLAADLRAALGLTHRQGRLTLKGGAVGEFDPKSGVIRTKAVQELDVLAHEATHALEYRQTPALKAALKAHADELKPLAYPGASERHLRQEGFAEFGRWYVTNPEQARKVAPGFYDAFEAALAKDNPKALAALQGIQEAYAALLKAASVDVARAALAHTGRPGVLGKLQQRAKHIGVRGVLKELFDSTYTSLIDDLHPINKAVQELQRIHAENTGKLTDLKVAENPYALARLSRDAYAAGHLDLIEGVVPYRELAPSTPGLADALEKALGAKAVGKWKEQSVDDFDLYLISRRMVHLWERYDRGDLERVPDRSSGADFHRQVIADLEDQYPTFKEAAGMVYEWNQALWKKERDAGFITEEAYQSGLDDHPDYVPLMRDMRDKGDVGPGGKPRAAMQFSGGVRQLKGSTRDVISPVTSMIRRAYDLNLLIRRNEVVTALDDLAQAAGQGGGAIVERLPAKQLEAIHVDAIEALERAAEAAGLSPRDVTTLVSSAEAQLEGQTSATLFRAGEFSTRKGEHVVFAWRDGKKAPLLLPDGEFGRDMFNALTGMNKEARSAVVDVVAATTTVLRQGVTLSPEFMARNYIRDQIATWINTDVGFKPVITSAKGAAAELGNTKLTRDYAVAGGMRAGQSLSAMRKPYPMNDAEARAQIDSLRKKGYQVRRYAGWRGLAAMTDLSEVSTRLGVFALATKQAAKRGLNDYEAALEGAMTSRDYLDFGRHGSKMVAAARMVTFLNAALQGLDKAARVQGGWKNLRKIIAPAMGAPPATPAERRALALAVKATAKMAAIAVIGGSLRALYADDPEYKDINERLRATHWFVKIGGKWISIPKPFELAEPSNIIERAYEGAVLKDPRALEHMLSDASLTLVPPHQIPLLAVPGQIASNRDYLGRPIVPDHLKGTVEPELQVSSYTSKLSRAIAAAIGNVTDAAGERRSISPAVIDHVITGFGGSLGRYLLQGTNYLAEKATGAPRMASGAEDTFLTRAFVRDVSRGSNSQTDFWDLIGRDGGKLTRAEGSFRAYIRAGDNEKATEYLAKLSPQARAYAQAKVFSRDGSSKLHPLVRAQEAASVISDLRQENRDGKLTTLRGSPLAPTPGKRAEVDDALTKLQHAEMRNALVMTGAKGWNLEDTMPRQDQMDRLAAIDPALASLVEKRMALARVPRPDVSARYWSQNRDELEAAPDSARLARQMTGERLKAPDRVDRIKEANRIREERATRSQAANPFEGGALARPPARNAFSGALSAPSGPPSALSAAPSRRPPPSGRAVLQPAQAAGGALAPQAQRNAFAPR
jgi:GNAT superfamily N-acetyltransferase